MKNEFNNRKRIGENRGKTYGGRTYGGRTPSGDHKKPSRAETAFAGTPEAENFSAETLSVENLSAENISAGTEELSAALDETNGAVVGRNAVRELLKSGRAVDKIFVRRGEREGSITMLVAMAIKRNIPVMEVEKPKLDGLACGLSHQGIVAMAAQKEYCTLDDILKIAEERGEMPLIIIADNINDPNNLGAMIRCAEGAGAHGIILPKRHSTGVSPAVTKASAGAVEHMAIAKVSNLAQCVDALKKRGVWVYAAEAGGTPYYEADYHNPCALIFGSEGDGVSRLLKEKSDFIVSVPMYGQVNSLNVSTAAAVIINEAKRSQIRI